ncbi:MAG: copper-containing nitrite reductase [Methylococcales bacterium]|nr:copper-containing nitrite reductase [Methylococcales bacterium]
MKSNKFFISPNIARCYIFHNNRFETTRPLLLFILIALVSSGGCAVKQPPAISTKSNAATQANPTEFRIISTEFNYSPNRIKVKEGQAITLTLDNSRGAIEHDFSIKELGAHLTAKAGQITSQTLIFKKSGEYDFKCTVPGHQDSGMSGKLTVEPTDLSATPISSDDDDVHAGADKILDLPKGITHLPVRKAAPALIRRKQEFVEVELEAIPVTALLTENVGYNYWTFNGTVPGPMIRLRQGDTVELTLKNSPLSPVTHSIDSHGITGPGGGAKFMQTAPGDSSILRFKAIKPGAYVYHCATITVPHHISNGMYGLMIVEPPKGWPKVDHEFYVMQGDLYLKGETDQPGIHDVSIHKLNKEEPDYVVFNGSVGALSKKNALKAKVGETVRIFFGVGGPNATSSFHIIGEMFDKVYTGGNPSEFISNVQTVMVPAGGSAVVDLKLDVPGTYILVDHSLSRLQKGAAGFLEVEGPENPDVFQPIKFAKSNTGGH